MTAPVVFTRAALEALLPPPRMNPGHPPPPLLARAERALREASARLDGERRCLAAASSWGPARVSECTSRVAAAEVAERDARRVLAAVLALAAPPARLPIPARRVA